MKYIRTKDEIYDLDKSIWYEFTGRKVRMPYCEEYEKQPGLCKTAETIEELCDEFVALLFDDETMYECPLGYYTEIFKARTHSIQSLRKNYDINMIGVRAIYGAIWTDKGLIYVAKMNEKGELELL